MNYTDHFNGLIVTVEYLNLQWNERDKEYTQNYVRWKFLEYDHLDTRMRFRMYLELAQDEFL